MLADDHEYNAGLIRELTFWLQGYLTANAGAPSPFHEHHIYALMAAENLLTLEASNREDS